jgi:hypothetical protein
MRKLLEILPRSILIVLAKAYSYTEGWKAKPKPEKEHRWPKLSAGSINYFNPELMYRDDVIYKGYPVSLIDTTEKKGK